MNRPYNFNAGPATLPPSVLQRAAADMLDWQGSGMGVMEMSHRATHFLSIYEKALADLRELLALPCRLNSKFCFCKVAAKGITPLSR